MKKKLLAVCAVLLVVLFAGNVYEKSDAAKLKRLSETLGVPLKGGQILQYEDSHGGLLGDGIKRVVIQFSDLRTLEAIHEDEHWEKLPFTQNLEIIAHGKQMDGFYRAPLIENEDGTPFLPETEDGWFWFMDRYSESTDPWDDSEVLNRHSYNFTLAVYDVQTNRLYYAQMDT